MSKRASKPMAKPIAMALCATLIGVPAFAAEGVTNNVTEKVVIEEQAPAKATGEVVDQLADQAARDEEAVSLLEKKDEKGWITGRLEIGWRAAAVQVDDDYCWNEDTQSGFLGTMASFEENDDVQFSNFIIAYHLTDWLGVSATWDQVAVTARTHTEDNHVDGEWKEDGPTLTAVLTTPKLLDCIVPYAEAGVHFPSASYEPNPWWSLGYPSQKVYDEFGAPKTARKKYRRLIDASEADSMTFVWGVGLKVYLTDYLVLDVAYRHIDVDETAHFYLQHDGRTTTDSGYFNIPLSYSELCAGIRLAF